ncbi:MBL fold metallo-hydrolase [Rhodobacter lacus]|uniref:MBL fold metallo-hydrolase n=1 Tax=Rhodobacter lacus TaxID=1641972 RepID=A0ABW5AAK7_9RHOB
MPRTPYHKGPVTDHFDGLRFHSPGQPSPDRSLMDIWRWNRAGTRAQWPKAVAITPAVPPARSLAPRITMVGHASVLLQVAGLNLLTDPVWSRRAGPLGITGPKRTTAPGIAFGDLPQIDAILLSHNHYDHLDLATLRKLHRRDAPHLVMPLGTEATARRAGRGLRLTSADWHETVNLAPGVSVTLTRANHWSSRGLSDRRMALWAGFWINTPVSQIWFAGDTGYGDGAIFRDIRARHGQPDIALIPIGAYAPRWFMAPQHVGPDEAVKIFEDVGAKQAYGIHWGTFQLTDEPREEPRELLARHLSAAGIAPERFIALEPGASYG